MSKKRRQKLPQEPVVTNIESLSHDGRGIAHIDGKTTFISGALPNETATFKYNFKRRQFDEGYTIAIKNPSENRVEAKCQYFDICGGCSMQHLKHSEQLTHKQATLLEQFKHFGNITVESILPPLTANQWAYRRKARLGVKYVKTKNKVLVGFREKRSSFLADTDSCEILHPKVATLIKPLQTFIKQLDAYNTIPQIEVAVDDRHCALVFRHLEPLSEQDKLKLENFAKEHDIILYLQSGGLDTVIKFYPKDDNSLLSYHFDEHNITLEFEPTDFSQVNLEINKLMVARVIDLLQVSKADNILDLFCGFGNFTLPLAKLCRHIVGVEGSKTAVTRAKHNANINHITNTEFYSHDLTKDFQEIPWARQKYDKLLIDPPRSGAEFVVTALAKFNIPTIVYVSCNPATLARDAGILAKYGYSLQQTGIMDMFPHTSHVESIALFKKM